MSQMFNLLSPSDVRKIVVEELENLMPSKKELRELKEQTRLLKTQLAKLAIEMIAAKRASQADVIADDTLLSSLPFSVRVSCCFANANIIKIADLKQQTAIGLLKHRNFGKQCLREVQMAGKVYGFRLKDEEA